MFKKVKYRVKHYQKIEKCSRRVRQSQAESSRIRHSRTKWNKVIFYFIWNIQLGPNQVCVILYYASKTSIWRMTGQEAALVAVLFRERLCVHIFFALTVYIIVIMISQTSGHLYKSTCLSTRTNQDLFKYYVSHIKNSAVSLYIA